GFERTEFAWPKDPPRSLALRAEFLHEHAGSIESETHDRAFRARGLRQLLYVDAASLREVDEHTGAFEIHDEELASASDRTKLLTVQRVVHRCDGLQSRELQWHHPV